MAAGQIDRVIRHLRRSALLPDGAGMSDGQLLEAFRGRQEDAAFEALMRRHGPMVRGVCRRVLRNEADAEDAFQATCLVLVRKAWSLRLRSGLGNWLYGVAYHTSLKARAQSAWRRVKEAEVRAMPRSPAPAEQAWEEVLPLLDEELSRLPAPYREAVVLCDLEGK